MFKRWSERSLLLCLELLFHNPLKNDILAAQCSTKSNKTEMFSSIVIFGGTVNARWMFRNVKLLHSRNALPRSSISMTCDAWLYHEKPSTLCSMNRKDYRIVADRLTSCHFETKDQKKVKNSSEKSGLRTLRTNKRSRRFRRRATWKRAIEKTVRRDVSASTQSLFRFPVVYMRIPIPVFIPFPVAGFRFRFRTGSPPKG